MDDSMKERLGGLLVQITAAVYIYIAILVFVLAMTAVLIVVYIKKKKQEKTDETADDKRFVPWRISIIVLFGALFLILSPILIGLFL